jgi:HTH-type transcriptional regulator/antitoxin HipB
MSIINFTTPGEMQTQLAQKFKLARLAQNHSRASAATLTGVPEATLRAFETTGKISLRQFLMLCHVYGELNQCETLFPDKTPMSMDELLADIPKRQRGRE